ncbi:MAG: UDP-N-acetyl-D-glucosamine 2-epimerase, UDP-hydrolysing [Candidatus Schekmanbacteria bacterium RBG_16_38_10]|uniref:UDP-N-acetyl-D-glucosamine 2-epimerase, UDP-hydrolysing n=1 Tax=Candidatus Schekmanbacteria bacterium RBG_16_38_10 TaxID=1817879 RepID=A0A1F7S0I7_9BACT|nr:MAG: UDP-N-acetyl-D-glucosamine 2-epimerase, UDP-hydrolysing [Candidatus Schekmanbacteria bacterium RBG_16_38_10]
MRKIAVVTGTRAEYGLLYWIIKGIHEDTELELQLIVTGMHLSPEFGLTVKEIEKDGFPIAERVEMLLSSDTETAVATSMGLGMIGFAKAYEHLRPDILVVLGDRFEILSAVASAVPFRIPVAHIHGGESTEGAMDELFRHAITKMSHIHFTATDVYSDRIIQMGEAPQNVYCFGAPGIDNISRFKLLDKHTLSIELGLPGKRPWGVVTFHPSTLEKDKADPQMNEILKAVRTFSDIFWIFTLPNADVESTVIIRKVKDFVQKNSDSSVLFSSVGQLNYLSLLKHAALMVGNSSSGIIEAPSFALSVVNIGDRQRGRVRASNVIDVFTCQESEIVAAIRRALSEEFKSILKGLKNPYGTGDASEKIVDVLKKHSLLNSIKKTFVKIDRKI